MNQSMDEAFLPEIIDKDLRAFEKNHGVMKQDEIIRCVDLIRHGTESERDKAIEEITIRNKPLIMYLIKKKYYTYIANNWDDLIQAGYLGILRALNKSDPPYDPRESAFSTYVVHYINHELYDCIGKMVHNSSQHYQANTKKVERAVHALHSRGIEAPTTEDIMEETGLGVEAIKTVRSIGSVNSALPLDHPNVLDVPDESDDAPLEYIQEIEQLEALYNALSKLPDDEKTILVLQFGLCEKKQHTQDEIARILHLSTHQVHRKRAAAFRRLENDEELRSYFENEYKAQEDFDRLQAETVIPWIVSISTIENEMLSLSEASLV